MLDAVQTSVYPKVIDCPDPKRSGRATLSAIAKNGVELKVRARVTVRTNLEQLIGGATEETIIARVGEGIITAIGSSDTHFEVMENPDKISKAVLDRGLDAQTAFEIVSIDIADIDVGQNIGARLAGRSGRGRHARGPGQGRGAAGDGHGPRAGDEGPGGPEPGRRWCWPRPRCRWPWPPPSAKEPWSPAIIRGSITRRHRNRRFGLLDATRQRGGQRVSPLICLDSNPCLGYPLPPSMDS